MIYDSRDPTCPKGKIIDLDTGCEVADAVALDTDGGALTALKVSDAYHLWQADPKAFRRKFTGPTPPPRYEGVPVLNDDGQQARDAAGQLRWTAATETRTGRFQFIPLEMP